LTLDPNTLTTVLATSAAGVIAYWSAFYTLVLDGDERAFARGLLRRAP
jgi:hypothetical protein